MELSFSTNIVQEEMNRYICQDSIFQGDDPELSQFTTHTLDNSDVAPQNHKEIPILPQIQRVNNQWYIPIRYVAEHPDTIEQECKQMQQKLNSRRGKWTEEMTAEFVKVVTEIGIRNAKPLTILQRMSKDYDLNTQMIGSKLQKYKAKIMKKYALPNVMLIENYMFAEADNHKIQSLSNSWQDRNRYGSDCIPLNLRTYRFE